MKKVNKISLICTMGILAFVGCNNGGSGSSKQNIADQNKPVSDPSNPNDQQKNIQDYLLIGSKGRDGKGAIFKCNLEGNECSEFISSKTISDEINASKDIVFTDESAASDTEKPKAYEPVAGDNFGSSIAVTKSNIFIGASGIKGQDKGPNGAVIKCDLDGKNCSEIDTSKLLLTTNDGFGINLYANDTNLFISATGRDSGSPGSPAYRDDIGAVFKCDLDGTNCQEFLAGKNTISPVRDELFRLNKFGSSFVANSSSMFIGANGVKGQDKGSNGAVFKCELDGNGCVTINTANLNLITNDQFGSSIALKDDAIFIGAIGRDSSHVNDKSKYDTGAVFKCSIQTNSCMELFGGQNQTSATSLNLVADEYFGSSLAISGENLFVGATGRKDNANKRTGAVFKCSLDGTSCIEFIGGQNKNRMTATSESLNLANGDFFGSSLTIASLPVPPVSEEPPASEEPEKEVTSSVAEVNPSNT